MKSNPLHTNVFPAVRKMENDIVVNDDTFI